MNSARVRALYKAIMTTLDTALEEAYVDKNSNIISSVEEAQDILSLLFDEYDEDEPSELNFD